MITIITNLGIIKVKLNHLLAPKTCENFINYVQQGFYTDTLFHRVIDNFMIQGGGLNSNFIEKQTNAPIENEAGNGLSNMRGTIAMARTNNPHSATSQFFINVANNTFLDQRKTILHGKEIMQEWGYTVFGKVVEGMDVVDQIKAVKTTSKSYYKDVPKENVIIKSITFELQDE